MSPKRRKDFPFKERLIILAAPSGAGKTTLCARLIQDFPNIGLSISTTTRAKRPSELDGVHYHFVTPEDFRQKVVSGGFAEWAMVHHNLYGTATQEIDSRLEKGQHVLFDIDVQGAMNLLKAYGERVLLLFILPPSIPILEERLRSRKGDSPAAIETRLKNAYNELEWKKFFDYQIVNDNLEKAYQELKTIVQKECF